MCLIAFAWNVHPQWPLVLVANRDEYHARPTTALDAWDDAPQVYGGRDLREGGGWLALDARHRRLAAVTNFREPALSSGARSRGALVRNFVGAHTEQPRHRPECAPAFADHLTADAPAYGPFNLLLWDGTEMVYASNRPTPRWESLPAAVHGLSNGTLNLQWPKVQRLTAALRGWLPQLPATTSLPTTDAIEPLLQALSDEHNASDHELPQTGVGIEMERMLSPPFIRGETYGTRASSVVLIARDGKALFVERRFGPGGIESGRSAFELPR